MTTYMTIGRCEFSEPPTSIDQSGPFLSIAGDLVCDSYAELSARRAQLNGMVDNPDEDVFPATFTETPEMDGFYAVESVQVGTTSAALMPGAHVAPYSITLRAVGSRPLLEGRATGVHRLGSTPAVPCVFGHSASALFRSDAPSLGSTSVSTADGLINGPTTAPAASTFAETWATYLEPGEYHDGGAALEYEAADSSWYAVVGHTFPDNVTKWRMTNQYVRFTCDTATGELTPSRYDFIDAEWEDCDPIKVRSAVGSGTVTTSGFDFGPLPTIVRNEPSGVVLKMFGGRYGWTMYLRPMADWIEVTFFAQLAMKWGFTFVSTTTSTDLATANTGIRQTTATADGLFVVLGASGGLTTDTTNGRTILTTATAAASTHYIGITTSSGVTSTQWANFLVATSWQRRVVHA